VTSQIATINNALTADAADHRAVPPTLKRDQLFTLLLLLLSSSSRLQ